MKKIVSSFLLALTLATVGSSNTFVADAQTNGKVKENRSIWYWVKLYGER